LMITGIMSTGGLTALAAKKSHAKANANERGSFDSRRLKDANIKSEMQEKEQR
jgi:hypothetical protein